MIRVTFEKNEETKTLTLSVNGHAGQAEYGKDIVCSSVSILTYTIAQCMEIMFEHHKLKKKPSILLDSGDAEIVVKPKTEHYAEALKTYFDIQVGFALLAKTYPQYVELKMFE